MLLLEMLFLYLFNLVTLFISVKTNDVKSPYTILIINSTRNEYKYVRSSTTFQVAEENCNGQRGELFYPETETEGAQVLKAAMTQVPGYNTGWMWIGASDYEMKGNYTTTQGRPVNFGVNNYWLKGQPNSTGNTCRCVKMLADSTLVVASCSARKHYVCKFPPPPPEAHVPNVKVLRMNSTNYIYKFHTTRRSDYREAVEHCAKDGGLLFYPETKADAQKLFKMARAQVSGHMNWMWIGASDLETPGIFKLVDGRPMDSVQNLITQIPKSADPSSYCIGLIKLPEDLQIAFFSCSERGTFICKIPPPSLVKGTLSIKSTKNVYKLHAMPMRWYQAVVRCATDGGELFFPETETEAKEIQEAVASQAPGNRYRNIWIGASDVQSRGTFRRVEVPGRSIDGEPNNWDLGHCIEMLDDSKLYVADCHSGAPYVCKLPPPANASARFNVTLAVNAHTAIVHTYDFYHEPAEWEQARARCVASGARLLAPQNDQEASGVWAEITALKYNTNFRLWVAANDYEKIGTYKTMDGYDIMTLHHKWRPNQPSSGPYEDFHCVTMYPDTSLQVDHCSEPKAFVCKY